VSGFRVRPRGCGALHPDRVANARRGVTLTEAVLFISVALGIIVGGLVYFQQARTSDKTVELIRMVQMLQAAGRDIARSGNFTNCIDAATLEAGDYVPAAYLRDDDGDGVADRLQSSRYDDVRMAVSLCPDGRGYRNLSGNKLEFQFSTIPVEVCTRVLPVDARGRGLLGDDIIAVSILVVDLDIMGVVPIEVSPENGDTISPSEAADLCGGTSELLLVDSVFAWVRF